MFRSRIRRVWGHAAVFAWRDLVLDRSRKLVGLQSVTRRLRSAGGDSDPYFENYDLFHAQSPDTGCGVHAARGGRTGMSMSGVNFSDEV